MMALPGSQRSPSIITPRWLAWTVTGADDPGFQRVLFLRLFQLRLLASALYVMSFFVAPLVTMPATPFLASIVVVTAGQTVIYLLFRDRSPALGGLGWMGFEAVVVLVGAMVGENPVPVILLIAIAGSAAGAVQYKFLGALVAWSLITVPYLTIVVPLVRPDPAQTLLFSILSLLVGLGMAVATTLVDTERRSAVAARRLADASQRELRAVLDAGQDPMVAVQPDGTVVLANRAAAQVFGPGTGATGGRLEDTPGLEVGPPNDEGGRHATLVLDGRQTEFQVTVTPMDPAEEPGHGQTILWTFRDVTAERTQARERMEFLSVVTHELRSPLTTVRTVVDLLLDPDASSFGPEQRETMLRTLQSNVRRWEALVDNLLTVSRIESDRFVVHLVEVDLVEAAEAAVGRFALDAETRHHHLALQAPWRPLLVLADRQWLDVIINNLVSNALKYTPDGGAVALAVVDGPFPALVVTDSGVGVGPDDLRHLFTRFFRVQGDATRDVAGTGLGLSICQHLARLHQGRITVASTLGQGSSFRLELPAAPDGADPGRAVS